MTSDPGASLSFQADPKKPIGGNILAHASTTRQGFIVSKERPTLDFLDFLREWGVSTFF